MSAARFFAAIWRWMRPHRAWSAGWLVLFGCVAAAQAHLLNMTRVSITVTDTRQVQVQIDVDLTLLLGDVAAYRELLRLPAVEQQAQRDELGRRVLGKVGLRIDGAPVTFAPESWTLPDAPPEKIGDQTTAAMTVFRYAHALPATAREVTVQPDTMAKIEFPLAYTFSVPSTGVNLTRWLELPGAASRVLRLPEAGAPGVASGAPAVGGSPADKTAEWNRNAPTLAAAVGPNTSDASMAKPVAEPSQPQADEFTATELRVARFVSTVLQHLRLGFRHIFPQGIDHVLFVLGLFFLAPQWRPLLKQTTAFTIAHTTTLGLSAYGIISLPARVVEPLIALSIAYVAVENIWRPRLSTARIAIVFAFGLLHGLGFASSLSEVPMPRDQFFTALLAFNLGVDFGQLAVIAAAFLAVGWARNRSWYWKAIVVPICAVIATIGGYWTVTRIFA